MKIIRDPYIFFSIFFITMAVLLTSYPIIGFLPSYISKPHDLSVNAEFTYYGTILDRFTHGKPLSYVVGVNITYIGSDKFIVNFTLYELRGPPLEVGFMDGFRFSAGNISVLCNVNTVLSYQNSSFIRLVIPKATENTTVYDDVKYVGFNRASFLGIGRGSFLAYPDRYLGYARTYIGKLVNTTSGTIITTSNTTKINVSMIFVRIGDHYLVRSLVWPYSIVFQTLLNDFGDKCVGLRALVNLQALEDGEIQSSRWNEALFLNYTNIVPSDQPWIEVFWFNFNGLAPLSYALIVVALILVILRVRRV